MTYQVIARKWRPQNFDQIIGQSHIASTLKNAIKNGRVGHAFLFTGVRGVGKTTTARILAKALNCESLEDANPCNKCNSCINVQKGTHIDVIEIDGASNTSVDDVKVLRDASRYLPSQGRYKIYIIDEVHMLSEKAFNALLKTLEEPPSHVKFIFATTDPHKIPITIKSRCQVYDFKSISLQEITEHLRYILKNENIESSDESLYLIARKAEGSMRDAQSLIDQVIAFAGNHISKNDVLSVLGLTDTENLFDLTDAIIGHDISKIVEIVDQLIYSGVSLVQFYKELIYHFHNILVIKSTKNYNKLLKMPDFELEHYISQSKKFDKSFFKLYEILVEGFDQLKVSRFQRITFEINLIKMAEFKPITPLKDILSILDRLSNSFKDDKDLSETSINIFNLSNKNIEKTIEIPQKTKKNSETIQEVQKKIITDDKKKDDFSKKDITIENKKGNDLENVDDKNGVNVSKKILNSFEYDDIKDKFSPFFNIDKNSSFQYLLHKTAIPVLEMEDCFKWTLHKETKSVFYMDKEFETLFSDWILSNFSKKLELVFDNFEKEKAYKFFLEKEKAVLKKQRIEDIKNSKAVKKLSETFGLKIKNIVKEDSYGR